jgi:hypothetical protein
MLVGSLLWLCKITAATILNASAGKASGYGSNLGIESVETKAGQVETVWFVFVEQSEAFWRCCVTGQMVVKLKSL